MSPSRWVLLWILVAWHLVEAYIETVVISGCESCKLYLTCRDLSQIIAILEADFLTEANNSLSSTVFPPYHPREALNKRCSGVNHCSFILTEDCPGARNWGFGTLTVRYMCVSENQISKFCNTKITIPKKSSPSTYQGIIHNPGYPRFYSSQQCLWKIQVHQEQKIKITILDISVTGECSDHVDLIESGQVIESICQTQQPPLQIISESNSIEIELVSRHSLTPLRGILLHYTAVGCPTVETTEDVFLLYRNDSIAEYSCSINKVFEDSKKKTKILQCLGAKWNVELPLANCTQEEHTKNFPGELLDVLKTVSNFEMTSDVLAPALIIAALFLINFMVLFYIYRIKQKNAFEVANEELRMFSPSDENKV